MGGIVDMKKSIALVLALALMLFAVCAHGEGGALSFDTLAGLEWSFSSGAGAWSTDMRFAPDGSFSGEYHDGEMGEADEAYPGGTVYFNSFTGQMSIVGQVDDNTWRLRVDSLTAEVAAGEEYIDDEFRFVAVDPYGISEGDEMLLFMPGTPVDALTEDMRIWAHLMGEDAPDALNDWFLYSEKNDSGFVGYAVPDMTGMANPWEPMTEAELAQASGLSFNLPEDATDAAWFWMEGDGIAELQFKLDGDEYCARVKPAALSEGELEDISGMYFQWDHEEEITVGHCRGSIGIAQTGSEDWVERCLWYDIAPGLMYSLSVYTTDPDGLDLTAVAELVYAPMQQDA